MPTSVFFFSGGGVIFRLYLLCACGVWRHSIKSVVRRTQLLEGLVGHDGKGEGVCACEKKSGEGDKAAAPCPQRGCYG